MLLNKLKNQAKIEAHFVPVRIPYRETIQKTAEAEGRHKKQTGGSGQFGDCWLRLSPNPGEGYAFVSEVVGGRIPVSYTHLALESDGLVEHCGSRWIPTEKGWLFGNLLYGRLLDLAP